MTVAPPGEAIRAFRDCLLAGEVPASTLPPDEPEAIGSAGVGPPPERRVVILDASARHSGPPGRGYLVPGDSFRLTLRFQVNEPLTNVAFGCELLASNGALMFNCDSAMSEIHQVHDLTPGQYRVEFDLDNLPLLDGAFTINARIQDAGGGVVHARLEPAANFELVNPGQTTGTVAVPIRIELSALPVAGSATAVAG